MRISKRIREALFVYAEGRSQMSGTPLGDNWEVDHKIPRAADGSDDLINLQAVTGDENRAKSVAHPPPLLDWQQEFLEGWRRYTEPSFLLVALPGTGKTVAALYAAKEWIEDDPQRRKVVVIVPTDNLRTQWKNTAHQLFGMQMQTKECMTWKSQMVGLVQTYQGLLTHGPLWQMRCRDYQVLLICDEIHHAGDVNEWGWHLRDCFAGAARRLGMSGTPFRGDSTRMPFVNYDSEGVCVANYRYDYPAAIRDGVIRVVCFQHERGVVRRLTSLGEENQELSSDIAAAEANDRLRHILQPGKYTEQLLRLADAQLHRCRQGTPSAGGLVLCIDQDHAQKIARQLETITGERPALIVSDDDRATETVDEFRESTRRWVVAVRQISEGIDIKRLMVLTYLTTAKTPLFFRQAVGRIVRTFRTPEDMQSYCFIPDHPVLVRHAQQITEAQVQAIEDESDEEFDRAIQRALQPSLFPSDVVLGTEHTGTAGIILEGETLNSETATEVKNLARELGCSELVALKVLKKLRATQSVSAAPSPSEMRSPQRPLEDQLDDARKAVNKTVQAVAFKLRPDDTERFKAINILVNRFIGKQDRRQFTLDDCRRAVAYLKALTPGDL